MSEKDLSNKKNLYGELQLPFKHSYLRGEIFPQFVTEEVLDAVASFKLRQSDVIITTFPKNGTTWTLKQVQNLHRVHKTGHEIQDLDKFPLCPGPWIERNITTQRGFDLDNMASPRYLKTHTPYNMMAHDPEVPCRYIYVARNPKDVCVSLYNHCKGIKKFGYSGDFPEFSQLFLDGHVESGDWWQHVKDHYLNSKHMDMLFLQYEAMHMDAINSIRKINDFCKLPELSDEKAAEVLELSAFKNVKDKPDAKVANREEGNDAPFKFLRKGVVGDWKNWFSQDMADKFDKKTRDAFSDTNLTFIDSSE